MRVRILTAVAGHDFSHTPGEVVDLPEALAQQWCTAAWAEHIGAEPEEKSAALTASAAAPLTPERATAKPELATGKGAQTTGRKSKRTDKDTGKGTGKASGQP